MQEYSDLLQDSIDLHIHSNPSLLTRSIDDFQLVEEASRYKMKAVVIKAHHGETVGRAELARKKYDENHTKVYGGLVLNHFTGGLNPWAVEASIKLGAKIIWMPTIHALNHLQVYGINGIEGLTVFNENGKIKKEVREILELIAGAGKCLATGHLGNDEILHLIPLAKDIGVKKILINHPDFETHRMDLETQKKLAGWGCFLEKTFLPLPPAWNKMNLDEMIRSISCTGSESCILSTDLGQSENMSPPNGFVEFVRMLSEKGIAEREIQLMIRDNPALVLGIE